MSTPKYYGRTGNLNVPCSQAKYSACQINKNGKSEIHVKEISGERPTTSHTHLIKKFD